VWLPPETVEDEGSCCHGEEGEAQQGSIEDPSDRDHGKGQAAGQAEVHQAHAERHDVPNKRQPVN